VAIARALVTQPDIVLADEPTANLDHKTGDGILSLMREINRRFGTTFVFSTHDRKVIDAADRLIGIEDGRIRYLAAKRDGKWHSLRLPAQAAS
jgi:putative ABC transport system ATP-binding protein